MGIDIFPSQSAERLWGLYLYSREMGPSFMGHDIWMDGMEVSEDWEEFESLASFPYVLRRARSEKRGAAERL